MLVLTFEGRAERGGPEVEEMVESEVAEEDEGAEGLSRASKYCSMAFRTMSMTSLSSIVGGKLVVGREEGERCQQTDAQRGGGTRDRCTRDFAGKTNLNPRKCTQSGCRQSTVPGAFSPVRNLIGRRV